MSDPESAVLQSAFINAWLFNVCRFAEIPLELFTCSPEWGELSRFDCLWGGPLLYNIIFTDIVSVRSYDFLCKHIILRIAHNLKWIPVRFTFFIICAATALQLMIWRCQSQHCPLTRRDMALVGVCVFSGASVHFHCGLQETAHNFVSIVCCVECWLWLISIVMQSVAHLTYTWLGYLCEVPTLPLHSENLSSTSTLLVSTQLHKFVSNYMFNQTSFTISSSSWKFYSHRTGLERCWSCPVMKLAQWTRSQAKTGQVTLPGGDSSVASVCLITSASRENLGRRRRQSPWKSGFILRLRVKFAITLF